MASLIRAEASPILRPVAALWERPGLRRAALVLWRRKLGLVGLALSLALALTALLAPQLAPQDPAQQSLRERLSPPFWYEQGRLERPLGTDHLGRDLLSRIVFGARVSLTIGLAAVTLASLVGTTLGVLAGYFGGLVDGVIMRLVDIQMAVPFLVLAVAVVAALGTGLLKLVAVLAITTWVVYARIARAQALGLRQAEFVLAARVVGASQGRILARHVLPNVASPLIVVTTQQVAAMILFESALSFLGLGPQPPVVTWGGMVADGRGFLTVAWWVPTLPGVAILLAALGINLLGDALRDVLDPRSTAF